MITRQNDFESFCRVIILSKFSVLPAGFSFQAEGPLSGLSENWVRRLAFQTPNKILKVFDRIYKIYKIRINLVHLVNPVEKNRRNSKNFHAKNNSAYSLRLCVRFSFRCGRQGLQAGFRPPFRVYARYAKAPSDFDTVACEDSCGMTFAFWDMRYFIL